MTRSVPTVVLLAAGLGRRFGGLKQVDPVGPRGTAILDYGLADAAAAGFRSAVVVVRPEIEGAVAEHLERTGAGGLSWALARQTLATALPEGASVPAGRTKPWGTAHAVLAAAPRLEGPFAVANADDHYGPEAWGCLGRWLGSASTGGDDAAAIGYRLADTLSAHGGVSRALCVADGEGRLVAVREALDVRRDSDGSIRGRVESQVRTLDADAPISMNLWGFLPAVLPLLREAFAAFVRGGPGPDRELHLPDVVGRLVREGDVRARLLTCGEGWFGMTHAEDRPEVVRRLAERGAP